LPGRNLLGNSGALLYCEEQLPVRRRKEMPFRMTSMQKEASLFSGWGESLAAVMAGNVVYFLARPLLPGSLQHELFRFDWGLFVDFVFCGIALVLIRVIRQRGKS
jgi:hypothetical protein